VWVVCIYRKNTRRTDSTAAAAAAAAVAAARSMTAAPGKEWEQQRRAEKGLVQHLRWRPTRVGRPLEKAEEEEEGVGVGERSYLIVGVVLHLRSLISLLSY